MSLLTRAVPDYAARVVWNGERCAIGRSAIGSDLIGIGIRVAA